jgi:glutathione reductase (NADPH)
MQAEHDLIVIGGGSGGLACAQRAARHGARVLVIESHRLGGTCVNVGCVPKKVMWHAAQLAHAIHDAADYGFDLHLARHDWGLLRQRRDAYVERLNGIYARNLEASGAQLLRARAQLAGVQRVQADGQAFRAPHIVLATGGHPMVPSLPGAGLGITSDGFFALRERPQAVAIIGAGYIAVELAGIFSALGSHTTLIARGERLLTHFEPFLGEQLASIMAEEGVEVLTRAQPAALHRDAGGQLQVELADGRRPGPYDAVIWATGRTPATAGLGLESLGVVRDAAGSVRTDPFQETNIAGLYAIGDVTGRAQLTPVAIAAGRRLADRLFGGQAGRRLDYENIPTVIFSHPPIATVGQGEAEARALHGAAVRVHTSGFTPLYHALTTRRPRSLMKMVTVGPEQRVAGLHVIGPGADELLQGFAVAMRMGATKRDFDDTVAIHPTAAEEIVTMK